MAEDKDDVGKAIKQFEYLLGITTPLAKASDGKEKLVLTGFSGTDYVSNLFCYNLDMFSSDTSITAEQLVGKPISFQVNRLEGPIRYFHGFVSRFDVGPLKYNLGRDYKAKIVPWLWFLNCTSDCKIYQNVSTLDIISEIFKQFGFSDFNVDNVKGGTAKRVYSVQYNETMFHYISRLLEEEGIYYYFEHQKDKHILVLADSNTGFKDSQCKISFAETPNPTESITHWSQRCRFGTGKWTQNSYDFEDPGTIQAKSNATLVKLSELKKYEHYSYLGEHKSVPEISAHTLSFMNAFDVDYDLLEGTSTHSLISSGIKFTFLKTVDEAAPKVYSVLQVTHNAYDSSQLSGVPRMMTYTNDFICCPYTVAYAPPKLTPKTRIQGCQNAIVVGPDGEEIYTDKYGRIKIRFYWDRKGKEAKEESSCWVRVAQSWAGKNWGSIFIPRVGQEVIVTFMEGDPEQPLVVGSLYNSDMMPPYALPDNGTQSGIKTHSSKQGGEDEANELRFEDKKGAEMVYLHAQKDLKELIENDVNTEIKHDHIIKIQNDRTMTVEEGNELTAIKKGNRTLNVETGNSQETIKAGNRTIEVSAGNDSLAIKQGNQTTKLDAGKYALEAMQGIELKVGSNSIVIDQSGITIKGLQVEIDGTMIQLKADASLKLQGAIVEGNGSGMVKIQGGVVMVN